MTNDTPKPIEMNVEVPDSWKDQKLSDLVKAAEFFGFVIEIHLVKKTKPARQRENPNPANPGGVFCCTISELVSAATGSGCQPAKKPWLSGNP